MSPDPRRVPIRAESRSAPSPDPRQGLCYQYRAPRLPETESVAAQNGWGPQARSGDDRTPMGVHEGLSCLACQRRSK